MKRVAIIGAGAAGCFCAVQLRRMAPGLSVTVFEAGPKAMAKLAITGGGRCNLTNDFQGIDSLSDAYPRGERVMKRALKVFSQDDVIRWFTEAGVPCVLQEDHCWFPRSQDAMDVVRCLLHGMKGVELRLRTPVTSICHETRSASGLGVTSSIPKPQAPDVIPSEASVSPFSANDMTSVIPSEASVSPFIVNGEAFDYVVVTTGGAPKGLPFLEGLGLELVPPVPSLFSFVIPNPELRSLMGLVVDASMSLSGTRYKAEGPLLITDWGLSGPAALKLSSYAARHLAEQGYQGSISVNWLNASEKEIRERLQALAAGNPQKQLSNTPLLQARLWEHLLRRAGLRAGIRWAELGSKGLNRLTAILLQDTYPLAGKNRFREEFVTAGGVALSNIDLNTLESKAHPGLFFAGEVLDIDAITGGFNLQAAWSTGYICARSIAGREK